MEIDFSFVTSKIQGLHHRVAVFPDGPEPSHMTGVQEVDNYGPVDYFFFVLSHKPAFFK
jgi:hypothetical protein